MEINELITDAESGNPLAQTDLGICYFRGYGVEPDPKKALFWYLKAAKQDEPAAMTNAGRCYMFGIGTDKNIEKAIQLLSKACEFDIAEAQSGLGIIYMYGDGIPANPQKAFELFTRAAEKESSEAFNCLGRCYLEGIGVEKDLSKAIDYFHKVRMCGAIEQNNYRYICSKININELTSLADGGNAKAQYFLGNMYRDGANVKQDINLSFDLIYKASCQNDPLALLMIGCFKYEQEKDYIFAEMILEKAVEAGSIEAQHYLEMAREKIVEKGTFFLVKITKKQYADSLRNGTLYMQSLEKFAETEANMSNSQKDTHEGTVSRKTPEYQIGAKGGVMQVRKIFCLYSLDCDIEHGYLSPPNHKLLDKEKSFGDTAVIILDVNEFIRRVKRAFSEKYGDAFRVSYKRVVYDADTFYANNSSYCDEFHKKSSYGWQREFRISLDLSNGKAPLKGKTDWLVSQGVSYDNDPTSDFNADKIFIDIGSIEKISIEMPINDFVTKIDELIDDKYFPPEKVETFFDKKRYTEVLYPVFYGEQSDTTYWNENPLENPRPKKERSEKIEKTNLTFSSRSLSEIKANIAKGIEKLRTQVDESQE
ncbi:MAG: sel1 repeat family protein [Chitinispirillales bacterium]|jgi:TPR repeat protein|nr:sel1 repeat family protein [Chitinispirillales bacterium]